jgi:hypothetical protein
VRYRQCAKLMECRVSNSVCALRANPIGTAKTQSFGLMLRSLLRTKHAARVVEQLVIIVVIYSRTCSVSMVVDLFRLTCSIASQYSRARLSPHRCDTLYGIHSGIKRLGYSLARKTWRHISEYPSVQCLFGLRILSGMLVDTCVRLRNMSCFN